MLSLVRVRPPRANLELTRKTWRVVTTIALAHAVLKVHKLMPAYIY